MNSPFLYNRFTSRRTVLDPLLHGAYRNSHSLCLLKISFDPSLFMGLLALPPPFGLLPILLPSSHYPGGNVAD